MEHWRHLMDGWRDHAVHLPFLMVVQGRVKIDWAAVIQGLVIAIFTTVATSQILIVRLEEQTKALVSNFTEFKVEAKQRLTEMERTLHESKQDRMILRERVNHLEDKVVNGGKRGSK